jgi:cell division protein FtsL
MPNCHIARRRSYCVYRRSAQKRNKKQHTTAQGFGSVGVFLFVCVMLSVTLYLFTANNVAIKGDEIYNIEKEISALSRENEQLTIDEAQLRSLERIESTVQEKGMEEIVDPEYIDRETYIALD